MNKFRTKAIIYGLVLLVAAEVSHGVFQFVPLSIQLSQASYVNDKPQPLPFYKQHPKVPAGSQTYSVAQAPGTLPAIIQATINPPDVHVGMKQTLTVIVEDPADITSVEALIQTDHATTTLPLKLVGPATVAELVPQRYAVSEDHKLVFLDDQSNLAATQVIKEAHASDGPKLKYSASWIVRDTHDKTYHTTFVVKDSVGRTNTDTLAWSDVCNIPLGGNWSLATFGGACSIPAGVDGVDNGIVTIASFALTINSSATFAFTGGAYPINITNGTINIASGGKIVKSPLWMVDADVDGYPASGLQYAQASAPAGGLRRSVLASYTVDCNDASVGVYQYLNGYVDADGDGRAGGFGPYSVCSGASLPTGYFTSFSDCQDGNALIYQNVFGGTDGDGDGYVAGSSAGGSCVGDSALINGKAYATDSIGNFTWLYFTNILGYNDCYDSNPNAFPGSTYTSNVNRGDGSFDYNCNGSEDKVDNTVYSTCGGTSPPGCTGFGYVGSVAACGQAASYNRCGRLIGDGNGGFFVSCGATAFGDPSSRTQSCY
jgi:hypothetical protein